MSQMLDRFKVRANFHDKVFLGSLGVTVVILFVVLFVTPAHAPAPIRALDTWARAHWTLFIWIMAAITVVDFVLSIDRFQTEMKKRLEILEEQMAKLRSQDSNPNRGA